MKRIFTHLLKLSLLFIFLCLIVFSPSVCIKSATDGLETCLKIILPSLFPFMVVSKYLIYSGYAYKISPLFSFASKLFNLPSSSSVAFFIGAVCGSPVGASCICDMVEKGQLTKKQGEHMLGFCNNTGPLFLIGSVGTILLSDRKIGYFIYLVHIISALITGIILRFKADNSFSKQITAFKKEPFPFIASVNDSVFSMLGIFGFVIIFSVICGFYNAFTPIKSDILSAIICGLLEISCGCVYISSLNLSLALRVLLVCFVCGFSGLCILFQTMYITKKTGLDIKSYLKTKVMFSLISVPVSFLLTVTCFQSLF